MAKINQAKGIAIKNEIVKLENVQNTTTTSPSANKKDLKEIQIINKAKKEVPLQKLDKNMFVHMAFITQGDPESIKDTKKNINNFGHCCP